MSGPVDPAQLAEVDRLVGSGNLAAAAQLLEPALAASDQATPGHWLQLAGLRRALKQPRRALDAVHAALVLGPNDFLALVMRAGLLERLGDGEAGTAWEHALAQRPPGDLSGPLANAVSAGERYYAAWKNQREGEFAAITAPFEARADGDAAWRIARFRDNALRRTKVYYSEPTHFHFPGLTQREFHPRTAHPWLADFEAATAAIRDEMLGVMKSKRAELVPYLQYQAHEPLAQWRDLNRNPDWTAIHLLKDGERIEANAAQCPVTMKLLEKVPQPAIPGASPTALFSLLAPNTAIPPHVGVNNARLLCHLPLVVPEGCWFRVGAETRFWREGEAFVFDDTMEHEAANPSDQLRVVMIFDLWHPDLVPVERDAISALVGRECTGQTGTPL